MGQSSKQFIDLWYDSDPYAGVIDYEYMIYQQNLLLEAEIEETQHAQHSSEAEGI